MSLSKDRGEAGGHSRSESVTDSTGTRERGKHMTDPMATSHTDTKVSGI